jgi:hypothetical protein
MEPGDYTLFPGHPALFGFWTMPDFRLEPSDQSVCLLLATSLLLQRDGFPGRKR